MGIWGGRERGRRLFVVAKWRWSLARGALGAEADGVDLGRRETEGTWNRPGQGCPEGGIVSLSEIRKP